MMQNSKDVCHIPEQSSVAKRNKLSTFEQTTVSALVTQMVKNLPAMQETWVQSLGWEDPLEKGTAPLQYSCLENSMGKGAWHATVHGVAKSWK